MTVEAMSSLPFQAGSAVAAAAGRTALWAISAYMRQPLRNTALAALIGLSAMAGSNALYKQSHHHPAPLFGAFDDPAPIVKKAKPAAIVPAARPKKLAQPISQETTGSVDELSATPSAVASADVTMLQQKLQSLGMFAGTVDGLFGPRTAKAIKAFETSLGKQPRGLLTPAIVAMIRDADVPAPAPLADTTQLPALVTAKLDTPAGTVTARIQTPVQVASLDVAVKPLPAPAPLLVSTPTKLPDAPVGAAAEVETAALSPAEDADPAVETLPMITANGVPKRAVQTIAVRAKTLPDTPQDMPGQIAPVTEGRDASSDPGVVAAVQRGLNSLGFLHQQVDGVAGEATAKAIRNFEVYFNYDVTGRVTRQLVNLLAQNGAST